MSHGKSILVIDDDPDVQSFCTVLLEAEGYRVRTAGTAAEGIAAAKAETPDLIILDVMMEESDSGFQAAGVLTRKAPVLMLTSIAEASGEVFDTSTLGVKELVQKPIEPKDLLKKVRKLLS